MIRNILPDVVVASIVLALAFFIAAGPAPSSSGPSASSGKPIMQTGTEQRKAWEPSPPMEAALTERNLFAETGSYDAKAEKKPKLPENPYFLVAVLTGKEKSAVFREYTGAIRHLAVGKSMVDGGVITEITPRSVKIRKGINVKELKLFDVKLQTAGQVSREAAKTSPVRR